MKLKNVFRWFCAVVISATIVSCHGQPEPSHEVRIGFYAPMSGSTASFGQQTEKGVQLAVEETNSRGGIDGKRVLLMIEDDRGVPEEAQNAVTKLITKHRVTAILGEATSSGSLAGGPVCQQYRIPMVTPTATNPKVTQIGNFIFRVCWIDPFQGKIMARFATQNLHARRVAVLYDVGSDYSVGLADVFAHTLQQLGGEVIVKKSYTAGDTDFSAQLTAIKAADPQALFIPGYYTEVGMIARQTRKIGIEATLLGGDGWDAPELLQIGGEFLHNSYYCTHFFAGDPSQSVQEFVRKFRSRFAEPPALGSALGYDATNLLFEAVRKTPNLDPVMIRDALAVTQNFPGVTGSITMDAERNPVKPAVVLRIDNGKPEFVERIQP